ncbi:PIN domain-containing protein [Glycomyces sp. NPDC046736]|uniref:PIN domain-containing protein n=1 Tax=Glycomyces sp. NPDC046736 TaxID=3155615 RepID=UPI00340E511E
MGRRLIWDTGVVIAIERHKIDPAAFMLVDDDVAVATVTLTELKLGVKLSPPEKRARRTASIEHVLLNCSLADYTVEVTEFHADLKAHCRRTGTPRGELDLMIAATALATSRVLVTFDRKACFGGLPGVNVIELPNT